MANDASVFWLPVSGRVDGRDVLTLYRVALAPLEIVVLVAVDGLRGECARRVGNPGLLPGGVDRRVSLPLSHDPGASDVSGSVSSAFAVRSRASSVSTAATASVRNASSSGSPSTSRRVRCSRACAACESSVMEWPTTAGIFVLVDSWPQCRSPEVAKFHDDTGESIILAGTIPPDGPGFSRSVSRIVSAIVTIETIYTLTAPLSCGQVCNDFQWLL